MVPGGFPAVSGRCFKTGLGAFQALSDDQGVGRHHQRNCQYNQVFHNSIGSVFLSLSAAVSQVSSEQRRFSRSLGRGGPNDRSDNRPYPARFGGTTAELHRQNEPHRYRYSASIRTVGALISWVLILSAANDRNPDAASCASIAFCFAEIAQRSRAAKCAHYHAGLPSLPYPLKSDVPDYRNAAESFSAADRVEPR